MASGERERRASGAGARVVPEPSWHVAQALLKSAAASGGCARGEETAAAATTTADSATLTNWLGQRKEGSSLAADYFFGCASRKSKTFRMFSAVRMNGVM